MFTKKSKRPSRSRVGRRLDRKTRGAAVVEFAFVAPIMMLLTMGMLEMSRVVMVKQLMVNASREGARMAVLPGATTVEVVDRVKDELAAGSVTGTTISVTPTNFEASPAGTPVKVFVSVPATSVSWIPNPVFTAQATIEAETAMRKESS